MWSEDCNISVDHPIVKIDQYLVKQLQEIENNQYEFLYKYQTNFEKKEKFNIKNMIVYTYNLGKIIDEKFTYKSYTMDNNKIGFAIKRNIFLKAVYEAHLEFDGRRKAIFEEIQKKLGKNIHDNHYTEHERNEFEKEYDKIEHEIYTKKVVDEFDLNHINKYDLKDLNKLIQKWTETCGLPIKNGDIIYNQLNIFPILLLSHQVYLYATHKIQSLEVNITEKMQYNHGKYTSQLYVETINDLIVYLLINFCKSNGYGFIRCEICGKLAIGTKKRKTCSEICKKKKNGNYNKKK